MSTPVPYKVTVLAYYVGFGDCLLLRFDYPQDRSRHVLIDFGTTKLPAGAKAGHMKRIAASIRDECGGKLDALVVTHRHADHISGFTPSKDPKSTGNIIARLKPDLVVQPWTEDPKAAQDETGPTAAFLDALPGLGHASLRSGREFVGHLGRANQISAYVRDQARNIKDLLGADKDVQDELGAYGEIGLTNPAAIENLQTMSKKAKCGAHYVYYGADAGFGKLLPSGEPVLPGVKVTVLGPPTLDQAATIMSQAEVDPEFWMLQKPPEYWALAQSPEFWALAKCAEEVLEQRAAATRAAGPSAGSRWTVDDVLPYARWLKAALDELNGREQLAFVRQLDAVLNNTSAILLFEIGATKLLFPGDAQIENWSYALRQPGVMELLADVKLYKVGHHGSRNATPKKALWYNFNRLSEPDGSPDRLITILSTQSGKHNNKTDKTEVPREDLVKALIAGSKLWNTETEWNELPDAKKAGTDHLCMRVGIDV